MVKDNKLLQSLALTTEKEATDSGVARGHAGHTEYDQKFPQKWQITFFRNSTSNLLVFRNFSDEIFAIFC